MAEHQPDEHYAEFLNITLKQAFDEWKILTIDVDNIQSNSLKTYLWLNALVTTGLFSLIAYADLSLAAMSGLMPIYGAGLAIAALASIASFIKASRMLQGTSSKAVTRFYNDQVHVAYYEGTYKAKQDWIWQLDRTITNERRKSLKVAEDIHKLNHETCFATLLGAASAALFFIDNLLR